MSEIRINFQDYFKSNFVKASSDKINEEGTSKAMFNSKEISDWLNEEELQLEKLLNKSALCMGEGLWHLPIYDDVISSKVMEFEDNFYLKKRKLKDEYFDYIDRIAFERNNDSQVLKSNWKITEDKLQFSFMHLSNTVFKSTYV